MCNTTMMLAARPYKTQPTLIQPVAQILVIVVFLLCVGMLNAPGQERPKVNIILLTVDILHCAFYSLDVTIDNFRF